jgi:putative DNA primase/helicase
MAKISGLVWAEFSHEQLVSWQFSMGKSDRLLVGVFETSPLAIINAPEKACAKTLLQTLLARMSYRQLLASNTSASALFRAVEAWRPTMFFDEADTFFRDNSELQGMVNAGYKRDGFVLRSEAVGDSFEPRAFSVYSAKSIAGIALEKHLPDSTMSRGIVFNLRRKLPHESVIRMRNADAGMFEIIAAKLSRFALDHSQQIRLARPLLPDDLSDRAQDNWEPLLAIAECAGSEWLQRATVAALKISSSAEESVSTGNELLADIQHVFEMKRVNKISTVDLIEALVKDEESSWAAYNRGRPLTPRQLAKQLSGYGIKSKTVRMGHANTPKGFDAAQFSDAFARYLTPQKLPQQRNDSPEANAGMEGGVADCQPQEFVSIDAATPEAIPALDCCGVAEKGAISGGGDGEPPDAEEAIRF